MRERLRWMSSRWASYAVIGMALLVVGLSAYSANLDRRLDRQAEFIEVERQIREVEARAEKERRRLDCLSRVRETDQENRLRESIRATAKIQQDILLDSLAHDPDLTPKQVNDQLAALEAYQLLGERFQDLPPISCVTTP